jgi:hypothetical protein
LRLIKEMNTAVGPEPDDFKNQIIAPPNPNPLPRGEREQKTSGPDKKIKLEVDVIPDPIGDPF